MGEVESDSVAFDVNLQGNLESLKQSLLGEGEGEGEGEGGPHVEAGNVIPEDTELLYQVEYHVQAEIITLARKVASETIASFIVIFSLLAVKVNSDGYGVVATLATSLIGGLVVMVTIFSLGHVSGSHINPAVTIAYTAISHFPLQLAPCYVCAHLLGATFASWVLEALFCPVDADIILVTPNSTVLHSLLAETLAGFLLLFVASSVSTDTRAIGRFAGLAVGGIIAIDIMIVGPISGGGINPARALGPAIVRWDFRHVWIYVVGPISGGLLGALVYRLFRPEEARKLGVHQPIKIRH